MTFWTGSITDCLVKGDIKGLFDTGRNYRQFDTGDAYRLFTTMHSYILFVRGYTYRRFGTGDIRGLFETRDTNRLIETGNIYALFCTVIFAEIERIITYFFFSQEILTGCLAQAIYIYIYILFGTGDN